MKITDLNIDCLEKVFRHLDYFDIFNVAESNALLREATKLTYRIKYGKSEIIFPNRMDEISTNNPIYITPNGAVFIYNFKIAFKLLRYFENSISYITISPSFKYFGKLSKFTDITCARLLSYVSQYHSKFLTSIEFAGIFSEGIEFNRSTDQQRISKYHLLRSNPLK